MNFLQKNWILGVLIGCLAWVPAALAEDAPVQQNQAASATATADAIALSMKKDAICTRCHDESETKPILALYQTKHGNRADPRTPNCQSCHGESDKHLHGDPAQKGRAAPDVRFGVRRGTSGDFAPNSAEEQSGKCLACHKKDANRSHWEGSVHQSQDITCTQCHNIHSPRDKVRDRATQTEVCFTCHKDQRAQINRLSHHPIPEGKMTCSDCHNPHGSIGPKLMKRDSINDVCYTCHMEKRGPFVYAHEPVGEDCTTCHNPHGTSAESLLKMRPPFLCQSCHTPHTTVQPSLSSQTAGSPNSLGWWNGSAITQGRGCVNCHTQIHGSNNPSLVNPAPQNLFR